MALDSLLGIALILVFFYYVLISLKKKFNADKERRDREFADIVKASVTAEPEEMDDFIQKILD